MEPAKFTPAELQELVAQTIAWMREQREKFLPLSQPLGEEQTRKLRPSFSAEI